MWSVPVHRWLSAYVHWPVLDAAARRHESSAPASAPAADMDSGTETASEGRNNKKGPPQGWGWAVMCVFGVSTAFHEAVVFVAMRGTCWPFNTFLLTVAGTLILTWDRVFPVLGTEDNGTASDSGTATAAAAVPEGARKPIGGGVDGLGDCDVGGNRHSDGRGRGGVVAESGGRCTAVKAGRRVTPFGSRGSVAVVMFVVLVQISGSIADYAAWLWWRAVFLKA